MNQHNEKNERGASYREYQSLYYAKHKEKLSAYHKEWYKNNKERMIARRKEYIRCECGSKIRRYYLPSHLDTKKHKDRMEILQLY